MKEVLFSEFTQFKHLQFVKLMIHCHWLKKKKKKSISSVGLNSIVKGMVMRNDVKW